MNPASKPAPFKIYLCAQMGPGNESGPASGPEARTEARAETDAATTAALLYLEQALTARGYGVKIGPAEAAACNDYQPQAALQLATAVGGIGCAVYHPVTDDWQRYGQSVRLARLLEAQARRYRLLCRREILAGAQIAWLQAVQAPAAVCVCNLPQEGGIYAYLPLIRAQMQGYAQAVAMWWEQETSTADGAEDDTENMGIYAEIP